MKNLNLSENFLEAINSKVTNRNTLINALMEMLSIEKEAVYRRLRGDVPFTFAEAAIISRTLGISVDAMAGSVVGKSAPFQLKMVDHVNSSEEDYKMMEEFNNTLYAIKDEEHSEMGESTNIIPLQLFVEFPYLCRFSMFKWKYQRDSLNRITPFDEIVITERRKRINRDNVVACSLIKETNYIFDNLVFYNIVNDINYFTSIKLITFDEARGMKDELYELLDRLEGIAAQGCYRETGNKFRLYISNINFDTSYWYLHTGDYYLTMIKSFTLNGAASLDERSYHRIRNWVVSLRRQSTLISESNERQRVLYFSKQRRLVNRIKVS